MSVHDWDGAFERRCVEAVERVCDGRLTQAEREQAWHELLVQAAPHVEEWARRSSLLRRAGLTSEDEPRAVLVVVLERLSSGGFENLRRFRAHCRPRLEPSEDDALASQYLRLSRLDEADDAAAAAVATPLRAWLLNVVAYSIKDHVRRRLGGRTPPPVGDGSPRSKRDLGTGAERLDSSHERGERPPITDALTMARVVREVSEFMGATFPAPMRRAVELWLDDTGFDAIGAELGVAGADARALVRAGQARLRERFRGDWDAWFAG